MYFSCEQVAGSPLHDWTGSEVKSHANVGTDLSAKVQTTSRWTKEGDGGWDGRRTDREGDVSEVFMSLMNYRQLELSVEICEMKINIRR